MSGFLFSVMFGLIISTVIFGWLAYVITGRFLSKRESAVAAFTLMLGSNLNGAAIAIFTGQMPFAEVLIGSAVGLAVLWWLFFKRRLING